MSLNSNITDIEKTTPKYYNSGGEKTYLNFYYDKGASYFGIIYSLGTNCADSYDPILFVLRTSYDGTIIKCSQINQVSGVNLKATKASNNEYVSLAIDKSSGTTSLDYLYLWITKTK